MERAPVSQDDRPDGLASVAEQLVDSALMAHQDQNVRAFVACCLADILRIFAPNAPYEHDQLQEIFRLFTHNLTKLSIGPSSGRGHGNDASERAHYVLDGARWSAWEAPSVRARSRARALAPRAVLATSRSVFVLCDLYQQSVPNAEEQMREFVECIFTNVRAEHLQADNGEAVVGTNMLEVLAIFLVETEPLPPRVLEVVLNALLPESKHDNPAAFDLAKELLHRCEDTAAEPVCSCLRMLLAGGGRDDQFSDSELSESIIPVRAPPSLDRPSRAADVRTRRRRARAAHLRAPQDWIRIRQIRVASDLRTAPGGRRHASPGVRRRLRPSSSPTRKSAVTARARAPAARRK